ncbi:MAG: bifunctional adenosylcobinamide kinase/adenosylcobinamide-phosphate guanylyltransferase [Bacillota bacterium]|nr:bifunctional adenosylcobinamide kinase/adenosylcobinamide-phosphate guanylyltransferase [Bacillota bacterium]
MTEHTGKLILVLGGARSGKSRLAEEMAFARPGGVAYIATAPVWDEEMARRVDIHRHRRPADWVTIEEPEDLAAALDRVPPGTKTVIVDCLTLWLTNLLLKNYREKMTGDQYESMEEGIRAKVAGVCAVVRQKPFQTIMVANEVGCGIVPEAHLGRLFRDIAGRTNQQVAQAADTVLLAVAGYPLTVKGGA